MQKTMDGRCLHPRFGLEIIVQMHLTTEFRTVFSRLHLVLWLIEMYMVASEVIKTTSFRRMLGRKMIEMWNQRWGVRWGDPHHHEGGQFRQGERDALVLRGLGPL
jgi:hypothetical protein